MRELARLYDTLLFDSYGVLVNETGGLPGAAQLIGALEKEGVSYFIVTNDASRSLRSRARMFEQQGVPVAAARIINSGMLIPVYLRSNGLAGRPTVVLGSPDAVDYAREGGADLIGVERMDDAEVFILADDGGFDWRPCLRDLVSAVYRRVSDGSRCHLLLPNPDLIYPTGDREYSFGAAGLALMVEAALQRLLGDRPDLKFTQLGKPFAPILEEAQRRAGTGDMVLIGDQLETDIAGANAFGIGSVVVTTGINRLRSTGDLSALPGNLRPDFLLTSLDY